MTNDTGPPTFVHPVLPADTLRSRPVEVRVAGRAYVLYRGVDDRPLAVDGSCPHRRAPLARGRVREDGRLACGYHGWSIGDGREVHRPAAPGRRVCTVPTYPVAERHGYLWLGAGATGEVNFEELDDHRFVLAGAFATRVEAPLVLAVDNFMEDEHFPYLHRFFGWSEAGAVDVEYAVDVEADRMTTRYRGPQRWNPVLPSLGIRRGDHIENEFRTRFDPIRSSYTMRWFDPASGVDRPFRSRTVVFFVPETETTTQLHTFLLMTLSTPLLRATRPLTLQIGSAIARREIRSDARFLRHLGDTDPSLRGMRLGPEDRGVVHARHLIDTVYLGGEAFR